MPISPAAARPFPEPGWTLIPGAVTRRAVSDAVRRCDELCAGWSTPQLQDLDVEPEPSPGEGTFPVRSFRNLASHEAYFYALARSPAVLDAVEQVLGGGICLYGDMLVPKAPGGSEMAEHQENAYLRVEPAADLVSCWIALDDADVENGCLHAYPGSHRDGLLRHVSLPDGRLALEEWDRSLSQPLAVRSGDALLYHPLLVTWSPRNVSDRWRRAFVAHYVRTGARVGARRPNSPPMLEMRL